MDADRIATVRTEIGTVVGPSIVHELLDALETVQAEHEEDVKVIQALRRQRDETEAERDAAQTENNRLSTELDVVRISRNMLDRERDRLTNQITDLIEALIAYRRARRAMVAAVQSNQMAPQHVTRQILDAESLVARVLTREGRC